MAKTIRKKQVSMLSGLRVTSTVGEVALRAAALYDKGPMNSSNVEFVLFLSGNSSFRVDVVAFKD